MARYGKRSVKDQVTGGLRTAFASAVVLGAVAGGGYYEYGTIQEQEVKVRNQQSNLDYSGDKPTGNYRIMTDKGDFVIEKSKLHMMSHEDASGIYGQIFNERTYKIKTWGGIDFLGVVPNVLSVREVTEDELKARAAEKAKRDQEAKDRAARGGAQPAQAGASGVPAVAPVAAPAAGNPALSGRVTTLDLLSADGKNTVQVTMPVEAAGKIVVNSVTPILPAAPALATPKP